MDKIAVIGDADTVLGFKLAGVAETRECGKGDCEQAVEEVMNRQGIGIAIISQEVVDELSAKTRKMLEERTKPVVVVIPGKTTKKPSGSANLAAMVKRAIGVDLNK